MSARNYFAELTGRETVFAQDLPEGETKRNVENNGAIFTLGVAALRACPRVSVGKIAALAWDLIGSQFVPVVQGPPVPTLSFVVLGKPGDLQACIVMPENWYELAHADPLHELGAIISACSQAVDFYNGKLENDYDSGNVKLRGYAYEAEFLLSVFEGPKDPRLNKYQRELLEQLPHGIASKDVVELIYDPKGIIPSTNKSKPDA